MFGLGVSIRKEEPISIAQRINRLRGLFAAMETQVKRLLVIGIVVALVVTMLPAVVSADDSNIEPSSYATIPFGILGRGLALIGSIVETIGQATTSTVFGIPLILRRIGIFIATRFADTLNIMAAETANTAGDVAEIVGNETSLDTGGVAGILRTIACALLTPFDTGNRTEGSFGPCG
jgi:hypothetical protein